jgi:hypothetical protein
MDVVGVEIYTLVICDFCKYLGLVLAQCCIGLWVRVFCTSHWQQLRVTSV